LLSAGAWGDGIKPLYGDPAEPYDCAHLFIAMNIAHFRPLTDFAAEATMAVGRVRSSARMPGVERISVPGERKWEQRQRNGDSVRLPTSVLDTLGRLAAELGVPS
jgi:LDH2 family malate/lactate/ureidoglycolate dehydrogenase